MKLLLLTPPLLQPNTPYPAMPHLLGFLESRGFDVEQRDLSAKVLRDILLEYGDETTDELLELLAGPAPAEAKRGASEAIEELARWIRENVDSEFGFARYAEMSVVRARGFADIECLVRRRGVLDRPLQRRLGEAMEETLPDAVAITCPFPGTLVAAFKIAKWIRRHAPHVRLMLGGGFVSTELREMTDKRPYKYFDEFQYDEGYGNFENLPFCACPHAQPKEAKPFCACPHAQPKETKPFCACPHAQPKETTRRSVCAPEGRRTTVPTFVRPSYRGIDWGDYFDVVETDNPIANLWNSGKWTKLVMARGCYWHKCAFCDVRLPYIGCFRKPDPKKIVDAMEALSSDAVSHRVQGFHFADEAMPPAVIRGMCEEIVRRKFRCTWWGNIRFDAAFTPELAKLMAKAGCVAVSGGLECANDRLLKLMNKGITLAGSRRVLKAFAKAGIAVHTYLMYGFPTETADEAYAALEVVRNLYREGLVQSAFWHRFALTVHSPVARDPDRFGLKLEPAPKRGSRVFMRNEIGFIEPGAPDWTAIGADLALAQYNYNQGRGLDLAVSHWIGAARRRGVSPRQKRTKFGKGIRHVKEG